MLLCTIFLFFGQKTVKYHYVCQYTLAVKYLKVIYQNLKFSINLSYYESSYIMTENIRKTFDTKTSALSHNT